MSSEDPRRTVSQTSTSIGRRCLVAGLRRPLALAVGRAQGGITVDTITDLGNRYAAALNNSGDVVGNDNLGGDGGAPFIYHGSGPAAGRAYARPISARRSVLRPVIKGLSDSGPIVGTLYTGASSRGFVADGNAVTLIQPPSGNSSDNITPRP